MPVIEVRNLNKHYGDCLVLQDVTFTVETGILSLAGAEQHVRFRPSAPLDERLFADLPEVRRVSHSGDTVIVAGIGNLAHAVTSTLARNQIIAHGLCIEQASLDDAFIYIPRNTPHTFRILSGAARWFGFGAPAGFDQWFFETGQPAQALTLPPPESPPDIAAIVASLQAYGTETLGSPPGRPNQVS